MYFQGVETERFQHGVKLMSTCTVPPSAELKSRAPAVYGVHAQKTSQAQIESNVRTLRVLGLKAVGRFQARDELAPPHNVATRACLEQERRRWMHPTFATMRLLPDDKGAQVVWNRTTGSAASAGDVITPGFV